MLKQLIAGVVLAAASCPSTPTTEPAPKPDSVIYWEWETGVLDISPPTRLDILMNYSDPAQDDDLAAEYERCANWGGQMITNPRGTIYICQGVDY